MKLASLKAFEKHLEGAAPDHFADVYLLMSSEVFPRKQGTKKLGDLFTQGKGPTLLSQHSFDAERHSIKEISSELYSLGFFATKKLIIVNNVEAFEKDALNTLEAYIDRPSRSVCLLLTAKALNRGSTLYKKVEKIGVVVDVAEEKSWEKEKSLAEWLLGEAQTQGKQLAPKAAEMLVKRLGTDQMLLYNELQKLMCFVGTKANIDTNDVAAICSICPSESTWQLGEAIFCRDASAAVRIGRAQLSSDTPLIPLLRQIRSQFQTEFHVCTMLRHGASAADISQEFPYMRGTILDRHMRQAQSYGIDRFKEGILAIDQAEREAKNSSSDPEFILDILMVKLTT